jgi:hypothetical protein
MGSKGEGEREGMVKGARENMSDNLYKREMQRSDSLGECEQRLDRESKDGGGRAYDGERREGDGGEYDREGKRGRRRQRTDKGVKYRPSTH